MLRTLKLKLSTVTVIYLIGFFTALKMALPSYIESSFLGQYVSETIIGLLFATGSLLALLSLYLAPRLLTRFGVYKLYISALFVQFLCFVTLGTTQMLGLIILAFILDFALIPVIIFLTDILLESKSKNTETGRIRGLYLTLVNLAWLISPLLGAYLLMQDDFSAIFYASASILILLILFVARTFRHFVDGEYKTFSLRKGFQTIWRNKNVRLIYCSALLLNFFYSWMVIYLPLHLRDLGFDWNQIYQIFFVMLVPFVLIDYPAGKIADQKLGEKELLVIGFIITAAATSVIPVLGHTSVLIWMMVMFLTRVGAALVEVMNDTYFFKKVGYENTDVISFYRTVMPTAYILGPLVASPLLISYDLGTLFIILSGLMALGLIPALSIKDTK